MKWVWLVCTLYSFILLPCKAAAQRISWDMAIAGGMVYNFRTPLHIKQDNYDKITLRANYKTEPFKLPVYYDVRTSRWHGQRGWQLKFTHHKLILENLPEEVQRFSITNGFNLLTLNRLWLYKGVILSAGGGMVITHPESTVRNRKFSESNGILNKGYYLSGPSLEVAVARQFYLNRTWFILAEGRASATYADIPVAEGRAYVSNVALHALVGTGITLRSRKPSSDQ